MERSQGGQAVSADDKADAAWDDYVSKQQEEKIEELERELNAANDRIKRLEEAGDTMANAYREICYDAYDDQQVDNWLKAKETKP